MTEPTRDSPVYTRFPAPVLIDQREKLPYTFARIRADKADGADLLLVESRVCHLETGDYTLDGYADRVTVERKSHEDLVCTLGQHRDRFEHELHRLSLMEFAAVVVEAEWSKVLYDPPPFSQLRPKTISRSVIAWQQRFPRVHWLFVPDRGHGEAFTFQVLRRFLKEDQGR